MNGKFQGPSTDNIFELNDGWNGLERILLIPLLKYFVICFTEVYDIPRCFG